MDVHARVVTDVYNAVGSVVMHAGVVMDLYMTAGSSENLDVAPNVGDEADQIQCARGDRDQSHPALCSLVEMLFSIPVGPLRFKRRTYNEEKAFEGKTAEELYRRKLDVRPSKCGANLPDLNSVWTREEGIGGGIDSVETKDRAGSHIVGIMDIEYGKSRPGSVDYLFSESFSEASDKACLGIETLLAKESQTRLYSSIHFVKNVWGGDMIRDRTCWGEMGIPKLTRDQGIGIVRAVLKREAPDYGSPNEADCPCTLRLGHLKNRENIEDFGQEILPLGHSEPCDASWA
nr:hypothetical protein Iba_chr12eCG5350 [Ipomoea batatas]